MARVGFVACSKTKSSLKLPAAALYTSPLFRKSLLAAHTQSESVYILSAKHGLLSCDDVIEPYDITLKTMKLRERMAWGKRIGVELNSVLRPRDTAVLFGGQEYLAPLKPEFDRLEVGVESPLGSLSLGSRLQFLGALNGEKELRATASSFFNVMLQLWIAQSGGRKVAEMNGRQPWPSRGVYFVLEGRKIGSDRMPRIVRVGTHAVSQGSKTTLWNRLSTHRGTTAGIGSHRSSIFRLHVGRAWSRFDNSKIWPDSWAKGQSASADIRLDEGPLEQIVSEVIGAMHVVWLDIDDEPGAASERAYIERNAIGLLSRLGLLSGRADIDWLSSYSSDWRIAASGLWNLSHTLRIPDPDFIKRLTAAVERTIGKKVRIKSTEKSSKSRQDQLSFLSVGGSN